MALYGIVLAFVGHLIYLIAPYSYEMVLFSCFVRGLFSLPR